MQRNAEGVLFKIPGLTKTRRSGPPKTMTVARFEDVRLKRFYHNVIKEILSQR